MSQETRISDSSDNAEESTDELCHDDKVFVNSNIQLYPNVDYGTHMCKIENTENNLQQVNETASLDDFVQISSSQHDACGQINETDVKEALKNKHAVQAECLTVAFIEIGHESSVHTNVTEEPRDKNESAEVATQEINEYKNNNNENNDSQSDLDTTQTLTDKTNSWPSATKQHLKSKNKHKERVDVENSQPNTSDAASEEVETTIEKKKKKKKEKKVAKKEEERSRPDDTLMTNLVNNETIAINTEDNIKTNAVQDENSSKQPLLFFYSNGSQIVDFTQDITADSHLEEPNDAKLTSLDSNSPCEIKANCLQMPQEAGMSDITLNSYVKLETVETNLEHSGLFTSNENQVEAISLPSDFNTKVNKLSKQNNDVSFAHEKAGNGNVNFEPEDNDDNTKENDDLIYFRLINETGQKQEGNFMTNTNEESAYLQLKKMFLDNQEIEKPLETSDDLNLHQPTEHDIHPIPCINELSQKEEHDVEVSHVAGRKENATPVEENNDLTRQCKKARRLVEQQHMLYSYLQDISRNFRSMELDAIIMKRDIIVHKYGVTKPSRHQIVSRAGSKTTRPF
jgi:hypothetical protein